VLRNAAKHDERDLIEDGLDHASSAFWADVWIQAPSPPDKPSPVHQPTVWLLTTGWKKHGRLSRHEMPARI
jgi:hypothetical protein